MSGDGFRALRAEDVEVRVGQCSEKGCSLLLYKTSRTDMALLDEAVGPGRWQCDYKTIDGGLFCGIGVNMGGEWVWKWDTGAPSSIEAQKGEASDAFKRAGFKWGIGRELYTAPRIFVTADKCTVRERRDGRFQCYDDFRVTDMAVEGGAIVALTVCNMSRRGAVVYGQSAARRDVSRFGKLSALMAEAESLGVSRESMKAAMQANVLKGGNLSECTDGQLAECEGYVATLVADERALMGDG